MDATIEILREFWWDDASGRAVRWPERNREDPRGVWAALRDGVRRGLVRETFFRHNFGAYTHHLTDAGRSVIPTFGNRG